MWVLCQCSSPATHGVVHLAVWCSSEEVFLLFLDFGCAAGSRKQCATAADVAGGGWLVWRCAGDRPKSSPPLSSPPMSSSYSPPWWSRYSRCLPPSVVLHLLLKSPFAVHHQYTTRAMRPAPPHDGQRRCKHHRKRCRGSMEVVRAFSSAGYTMQLGSTRVWFGRVCECSAPRGVGRGRRECSTGVLPSVPPPLCRWSSTAVAAHYSSVQTVCVSPLEVWSSTACMQSQRGVRAVSSSMAFLDTCRAAATPSWRRGSPSVVVQLISNCLFF